MADKYTLIACVTLALLLCSGTASKAEENDEDEPTTASPMTHDMSLVDMQKVNGGMESVDNKQPLSKADSAQPHTIADFIIHPLIALKPRQPEEPFAAGKQAEASTTPSPWQLFGFNPAQGIGSSVSSIADTVSGWLGNRIPLPALVDTPVSALLPTTSTSTTTPRPDVVVRVEHGSSTRRPLIQIGNEPDHYDHNDHNDYDEYPDDEEYDYAFDNNADRNFGNSIRNHRDDEYDGVDDFEDDDLRRDEEEDEEDVEDEEDEEEEEEEEERPVRKTKPNNRRKRPTEGSSNRRGTNKRTSQKKRPANRQGNRNQKRRRPQNSQEDEEDEEEEEEVDVDVDDNEVEEEDDYDQDNNEDDQGLKRSGSTKRSQNQQNFIQRGQQSLISQIRQLTRGQSPAELSSNIRKGAANSNSSKKRHQQATLIINRNGQTIYIAPELMSSSNLANQSPVSTTSNSNKKRPVAGYPKPPLASSYKRKGKPTQYITIPWTQLGISPPTKLVSVTEGVQTQPLILNIPQSALDAMQGPKLTKKQTVLTSEAVPLLAEASLMDVFKPPQIPHNRSPSSVKVTKTNASSMTPLLFSTKTKQRVRPGTIVEKSPAMDTSNEQTESSTENSYSADNESEGGQYILVGEDTEDGLGRHAIPILGEPRHYTPLSPYLNIFHSRQYKARSGRQTKKTEKESPPLKTNKEVKSKGEQPKELISKGTKVAMGSISKVSAPDESTSSVAIDEKPAFEEPKIEILKSIEAPMKQAPVVKSHGQVIPVHVLTSRFDAAAGSQGYVKDDQTKSE